MLDGQHADVAPFRSRWILAEPARDARTLSAYHALRTRVFVAEQGLFSAHDRDEHDAYALPLVAIATSCGVPDEVVGVVRIYPAEGGTWYGGRLAVTPPYRRSAEVGGALIRAAVGAARGLGATRFLATVQAENRGYFERHGFGYRAPVTLCGRPHVLMEATLARFVVPPWVAHAEAA